MDERRSKIRIFLDILRLIQRRGGVVKPTHILYGANLSHARLNRYLGMLIEQGFIEQINKAGRMYYRVTPKGRQFMIEFKKVEELTEAFGISL